MSGALRGPVRMQSRTPATYALFAANVLVFGWTLTQGAEFLGIDGETAFHLGANHGPAVVEGEGWRLATSVFLHSGVLHLAFNLWALRVLGPFVESFLGSAAFLALYALCGVGASLCSVAANPDGLSLGASGAVFALLGAHLAFYLRHRRELQPAFFRDRMRGIVLVIAVNLAFGFSVPQVDNAAHVGGLALGVLGGALLDRPLDMPPRLDARRAARALVLAAVLVPLAWLAVERVRALG